MSEQKDPIIEACQFVAGIQQHIYLKDCSMLQNASLVRALQTIFTAAEKTSQLLEENATLRAELGHTKAEYEQFRNTAPPPPPNAVSKESIGEKKVSTAELKARVHKGEITEQQARSQATIDQ